VTIDIPFPPTLNNYRAVVHGQLVTSAKGRRYHRAVEKRIGEEDVDLFAEGCRLCVSIEFCPPDRRRRDLDNFLKAPLDSLKKAGVYDDDSQVDLLIIKRGDVDRPDGHLMISVTEVEDEGLQEPDLPS
jgi:crossover junction endodeoxyribonuclease RusA